MLIFTTAIQYKREQRCWTLVSHEYRNTAKIILRKTNHSTKSQRNTDLAVFITPALGDHDFTCVFDG